MEKETPYTGGLSPLYQHYKRQKCFIGLSHDAQWREEIVSTCDEVLPSSGFDLEPWYADHYYDPTKPLLDIIVEMIANARYGIYDLSYWHKDGTNEWMMPRNVFIELGIAIALNRPTLLLQHEESRVEGPKLPDCLESIRDRILPFTGNYTLKEALEKRLPQWVNVPPEQEWRNRYCLFGKRTCMYREVHPRARHWTQGPLPCHISHGPDHDQKDFRPVIEAVLKDYNDVQAYYLNELSLGKGYEYLLCTHCQTVRSTPFAIYRITPETPVEAFIAIGMSIALETQFNHKIPKILLAEKMEDVPSLLAGYKVVLAKNNIERKQRLQEFLPMVYQVVRTTTWKSRPLPFIEVVPRQSEKPFVSQQQQEEIAAEEAKVHNEQGNAFYKERRYDEALAAYQQAIQLAPIKVQYHYNKGITLHNLNRHQEALAAYEQAIQIDPDHAPIYGGKGSTYLALKQYQEALQNFDRALKLDPTLDWVKAQREEVTRPLKENNAQSQPKELTSTGTQTSSVGSGTATFSPADASVAAVNPQTSPPLYPDAGGNTQPSVNRTSDSPSFLERLTQNFNPFQTPPLQSAEIQRRLERAMEDNSLLQGEGRRLAPDVYDIYLSSKDFQQFSTAQSTLIREWQQRLLDFARRHHFTLRMVPVIRLHSDTSLRTGTIRIDAELAHHQVGSRVPTQPLSTEGPAQLSAQIAADAEVAHYQVGSRVPTQPLSTEGPAQLNAQIAADATEQPGLTSLGGASPNQPSTASSSPSPSGSFNNYGPAPTIPSTQSDQMAMPEAWLTIRSPQAGQQTHRIAKPIVNIGRQLNNDIMVDDKSVSRYHAQIKFQPDDQFVILDLGSINGITINNTPNLRDHVLRNGDHFTIGSYDFYFERR